MDFNKRAQIETIGLVVIIILLVTLGFIFISFIKPEKQESLTQSTAFLIESIVKTQTPYGSMKELVAESYESKDTTNLKTEINQILEHFKAEQYSIKISANEQEFFTLNSCEGILTSKIFTKNKIKYTFTLIECKTL